MVQFTKFGFMQILRTALLIFVFSDSVRLSSWVAWSAAAPRVSGLGVVQRSGSEID